MSITAERKQALITEYATKEGDTGSPEVQVAILSERIRNLTDHLTTHKRTSTRGADLLVMVGQRRRVAGLSQAVERDALRDVDRTPRVCAADPSLIAARSTILGAVLIQASLEGQACRKSAARVHACARVSSFRDGSPARICVAARHFLRRG